MILGRQGRQKPHQPMILKRVEIDELVDVSRSATSRSFPPCTTSVGDTQGEPVPAPSDMRRQDPADTQRATSPPLHACSGAGKGYPRDNVGGGRASHGTKKPNRMVRTTMAPPTSTPTPSLSAVRWFRVRRMLPPRPLPESSALAGAAADTGDGASEFVPLRRLCTPAGEGAGSTPDEGGGSGVLVRPGRG